MLMVTRLGGGTESKVRVNGLRDAVISPHGVGQFHVRTRKSHEKRARPEAWEGFGQGAQISSPMAM